jgi:integral membrane protein
MTSAFRNYKVMSYVTGVALICLFLLLLVKQVNHQLGVDLKVVSAVLGIGHGVVLYPIYLVTCFQLLLKARIGLVRFLLMLLAGFVPGLAFFMERRNERDLVARNA